MGVIHLTYPTSWEDVSKKDLKIIAKTLLLKLSRTEMLLILFCRLAGIRLLPLGGIDEGTPASIYFFQKGYRQFTINTVLVSQACKQLEFILDCYGLPACPLKGINAKLYDVPFRNYFFADAHFTRYAYTQERAYLKESIRELTGRKIFPSTSLLNAYAIWFTGLQNYLRDKYRNLFTESDGTIDKTPAEQLQDILSAVNKDEPQKNEAILHADTHAVLTSLDNIYFKIKHANTGIH